MKTRKNNNNKNKTKQKQNKIVLKKKSKTQNNKKNRKNRKTVSLKKVQKGGRKQDEGFNSSHGFPDSEKYFDIPSKRAKSTFERKQQKKQHEEMKKRTRYKYMKKNKNRIKAEKFEEYKDIAEKNELSLGNLLDFFRKQSELYNNRKSFFSIGFNRNIKKQIEEQREELQNEELLNFDTYKESERKETEYTVDFNPYLFEPGDLIFVTQVYQDLTKPEDRGILSPFYYEHLKDRSHTLNGTRTEGNPDELEDQEIILKESYGEKGFIGHAKIQGLIKVVPIIKKDPEFDKRYSDYFARKYRVLTTPLPILLKEEDLYHTKNNEKIKKQISDTVINIDQLPSQSNSTIRSNANTGM